jgi:hypothetical protein
VEVFRGVPAGSGNGNSIWKCLWRLSQNGTLEALFEAPSLSESTHLAQMFDSTIVRAHVSAHIAIP